VTGADDQQEAGNSIRLMEGDRSGIGVVRRKQNAIPEATVQVWTVELAATNETAIVSEQKVMRRDQREVIVGATVQARAYHD
jgi:hypothetical protein